MTHILYHGLVNHADVNQNEREVDGGTLLDMMFESANQVASATSPVVPGSMAADVWGSQREAVLARYEEIAAECRRRRLRVYAPEETPGHSAFRR